jgi:RND family efflux transporter MFP subunit
MHKLEHGRISECLVALCVISLPVCGWAASYDCLIEPTQTVEVGSPVGGLLEKVNVKRGDRVSRGQVVASLESRAEMAAMELAKFKSEALGPTETAKNKIEFSHRKFLRRKEMAAERLGSLQERDDAEAEFQLARAELLAAQESRKQARFEYQQQSSLLNLRLIRSPFDGVVVDQVLYPGEIVESGGAKKTILKLAQLDPLRIRVILPMSTFGRLKTGMSAEIVPELPIGGKYQAVIKFIDRLVDAPSGTFAVFLDMSNKQLDIPAGVKCKAVFATLDGLNESFRADQLQRK